MAQASENAMAAATPWIDKGLTIATSHTALTLYALAAAVILIGLSINIARGQRNELLGPSPFRGRTSTRQRQIRERLALLEDQKTSVLGKQLLNFLMVMLAGLVVPIVILGAGLVYFDWLVPGAQALTGVDKVTFPAAISFLLSQFAMGMDSQALQPAHAIVAWGALIFRYFIGAFVLMALHLFVGMVAVARNRERQIETCRKLLAAAPAAPVVEHHAGHDTHAAHDDHGHGDAHGHDDHGHGHGDHGHAEKAHDDHGHGDHGHGDHGHAAPD